MTKHCKDCRWLHIDLQRNIDNHRCKHQTVNSDHQQWLVDGDDKTCRDCYSARSDRLVFLWLTTEQCGKDGRYWEAAKP